MSSTMRHRPGPAGVLDAARVIGFGLLALATLSAAACSPLGPAYSDSSVFTWSGQLKAPASVHLRNMNGAIQVEPSEDDNVRVKAGATWHRGNPKTDLQFQVESAGSDLTVCVLWNKGSCSASRSSTRPSFWNGLFKRRGTDANVTLTVYVPARVKLDVVTVNGSVHVATTAPVYARTMNGDIKVATAVGPVDAHSMNGDVDVRMTTLGEDGPVRAITLNGSASVYLPEKVDATVEVSTTDGQTGSDFAITTAGGANVGKHLRGTIGAGGREVKVSTLNGSAWLRRLNADGTVATAAASAKP